MRGTPAAGAVPSAFATPKPSATPAEPARAESGFGSQLVAGLIGAGLAAAAVVLLMLSGAFQSVGDTSVVENDLEALRGRLDAIERDATAAAPVDLAPIEERLAQVEARTQEMVQAGEAAPTVDPARIDEIAGEVEALRGELAPLNERLAAIDERLGQVDPARLEPLYGLPDTVGGVEQRLDGLEQSVEQAGQDRAALGVALVGLQGAVSRGEPFTDEIAALERFDAVSAESLSALRPYAESGVRTTEQLAREFGEVANDVVAAASASGEGVVNRIWAGAQAMVQVRPVGPVQGDSVGAVVSRIEAALGDGHLPRALDEWQTLPQSAQQASAEWADEARARLAADRMTKDLSATLLGAAQNGDDRS